MHGGDVGVGALLQAVLKHGTTGAPAPYAAEVAAIAAHTVDGAGEDAALDGGGRTHSVTDDAASVVAADVERGGDGAVLNEVSAFGEAHETRGVVACRGDGSGHGQILDGGSIDIVERSHALLIRASTRRRAADIGRDGVAVAEEDAAEGIAVALAHRLRNRDVGGQFHVLAAIVVGAAVHFTGKQVPVSSAADGIGTF